MELEYWFSCSDSSLMFWSSGRINRICYIVEKFRRIVMVCAHGAYSSNVGFRIHVRFHVDDVHVGIGDNEGVLVGQ